MSICPARHIREHGDVCGDPVDDGHAYCQRHECDVPSCRGPTVMWKYEGHRCSSHSPLTVDHQFIPASMWERHEQLRGVVSDACNLLDAVGEQVSADHLRLRAGMAPEGPRKRRLADLLLTGHTARMARVHGLVSLGDVQDAGAARLLKLKGLGRRTVNELREVMDEAGLILPDDSAMPMPRRP